MKKILVLIIISINSFSQSVTISPQTIDKVDNSSDDLRLTSYQFPSTIVGARVNGTVQAKTRVLLGNLLMQIEGKGFDGSSFYNGGRIKFKATQDWDITNGAAITFETTPNTNSIPVERMIINHDGRVGIGLTSPDKILDINGRMRLRHTPGFTSGIWMSNSTNSLSDADGAFFGMENDNKAGIYINNAWRFGVNNSGEISTSSMVGSGSRMVLASPTGVLFANNQPQVWSITGSAFESITGGVTQFSKGLYSAGFNSGSSIMVTPVNLPTGVEISEIKVFFKDASASSDMLVRFSYENLQNSGIGSVSIGIVGNLNTSNVTGIQSSNLALSNSNTIIDNANRAYYIEVSSANWNSNLEIYGIKITYSY